MKVVYVTGLGRSGTTLLDVLLNAHSGMAGVGEVHKLRKFARLQRQKNPQSTDRIGNSCACGAEDIWQCPFWTAVNTELEKRYGRKLDDLDLEAADAETFRRDNLELFSAVAASKDVDYVVDSSKRVTRLRHLLKHPDLEVLPIHVMRNPKGRANSVRRRKGQVFRPTFQYSYRSLRLFGLLFDRPHLVVRYERLASEPEAEMRRIMEYLGLAFEPAQVSDWASQDNHNLAGNGVRTAQSSEIALRETWQEDLGRGSRLGIDLLAVPGRVLNWLKERRWRGVTKGASSA
ncbi:sulfotransferase family protein [Thiohalorhabdus sp. Cl-TMA]|uniref:Sulfotransferase n=1 Tax=Thiohalorhabdus methylotrophus TaxID=3242694 RepID=A0ABV4TTA6_9GAMM